MRNRLIAIAAAALGLLAISTAASAASFQSSPGGAIIRTSLGKITFAAGELRIECNLTMHGRLLTTATSKIAGTKIGEITELTWTSCVGGEIETVLGLPWSKTYKSITGTLPEGVTSINFEVVNFSLELSTFGGFFNCLYSGNAQFALSVTRISGSQYRSGLLRALENSLRLVSGFGCPSEGRLRGTFATTAQTITRT